MKYDTFMKKPWQVERFLGIIEQMFKTDSRYLLSGGFWLTIEKIIAIISSLGLAIVFARILPKEIYGQYKYILSLGSIIGALSLTGLDLATTQSVARGFEGMLKKAFWLNLRWSLLLIATGFALSLYYGTHHQPLFAYCLIAISLIVPLMNSVSFCDSFFTGKKDFRISNYYNNVQNITLAISLSVTAFLTHNLFVLVIMYFLITTIISGAFYLYIFYAYKPNNKLDPASITYSKHLSLIGIMNIISDRIDTILIFHYLGPINLAIYTFAIAIPEQIKGMIKSIAILALPKFSQRTAAEINSTMKGKMIRLGLILIVVIICYFIAAPFIYKLLFPTYLISVKYSRISIFSLLSAIGIFPSTALQSQMAKKELYKLNIFSMIIQVGLMLIGVYFYGVMGMVVAILIARYLMLGYSYYLMKTLSSLSSI